MTSGASHRKTLDEYSEQTLRFMLTSSATVTITAYCLWAFEGQGARNPLAALSILPLVLGLYRYALLREGGAPDSPEDLLLRDRFLQVTALAWVPVSPPGSCSADTGDDTCSAHGTGGAQGRSWPRPAAMGQPRDRAGVALGSAAPRSSLRPVLRTGLVPP